MKSNNNIMNIRENCPLCNNKSSSKEVLKIDQAFVNFINSYYGDASFKKISKYIDSDITYAQCNTCQLIYQQNILNDKGMFELYESLIDPQKSLNKRLSYSMTQNLRGVLLLFSLIFKIKKPIGDITVVDLGMGFGNMLSYAKALGCKNSFGIELSQYRIDYAKENFGIDSYTSLSSLADNSIDVIISNQSLEHIADVRGNLDLIEQKLSLGGITYITVPNASQKQKLLQKGAFQPLEHINSFTSKSRHYFFSNSMKHKFMIKNLRKGSGTIWLFEKVKNT
jgi:2-polyprenyl-3-methyl-5-hydroxy-6-metoxy-1,4-benzoquinol methylase